MDQKKLRASDNLIFEDEKTGANIEIPFGTEVEIEDRPDEIGTNVETGQEIRHVHVVYNGHTVKAPRNWFDVVH